MANQIRTSEEIEKLKASYKHDPCWDIEDSEGFEDYHDELLAWRKEYEAECEAKNQELDNQRIEKVMNVTGIGKADKDLLLSLFTWKEIENNIHGTERNTDDPQVSMIGSLVRATLLQAAQLKRIADALESMADGDSLSNSVKLWGSKP
jgi:hypothetical protein